MSELNKTTVRRFMTLAGLKQKSESTGLLKEVTTFDMPDLSDLGGILPVEAPIEAEAAVPVEGTPIEAESAVPVEGTEGIIPEPTFGPVGEAPIEAATDVIPLPSPGPTGESLERADSLKIMSENQEKIVDKIADVMLKYLSDK